MQLLRGKHISNVEVAADAKQRYTSSHLTKYRYSVQEQGQCADHLICSDEVHLVSAVAEQWYLFVYWPPKNGVLSPNKRYSTSWNTEAWYTAVNSARNRYSCWWADQVASFDCLTVSTWACTHIWLGYHEAYLFLSSTQDDLRAIYVKRLSRGVPKLRWMRKTFTSLMQPAHARACPHCSCDDPPNVKCV